jgi:hypothetical protein
MSRSGYDDGDDGNNWGMICWRGAVNSAIKGARGQSFLKEMLTALDAMPEKKLIAHDLEAKGEVCAIGAVGIKRGVDMSKLDPEDRENVAHAFGIAPALAAEIVYMNDEWAGYWSREAPEARFARMREWVASQIKPERTP